MKTFDVRRSSEEQAKNIWEEDRKRDIERFRERVENETDLDFE
jgi:hypothetical protein